VGIREAVETLLWRGCAGVSSVVLAIVDIGIYQSAMVGNLIRYEALLRPFKQA
jgi:hypothetical protein